MARSRLLGAYVEVMLATGDTRAAPRRRRSVADRRRFRRAALARGRQPRHGAINWPRATLAPRSPRCAVRGPPGRIWRRRMKRRAFGCSSGSPAGRSGTRNRRPWNSTRRVGSSASSAPRPTWPGSSAVPEGRRVRRRADRARGRDSAPRGSRQDQPGDRGTLVISDHGPPPPPEHLRQARRASARHRVRIPARSHLTRRVVRTDHAPCLRVVVRWQPLVVDIIVTVRASAANAAGHRDGHDGRLGTAELCPTDEVGR